MCCGCNGRSGGRCCAQYRETDPFKIELVVSSICEYAGPGHWVFFAGINKLCKQLYSRVGSQLVNGYYANNEPVEITSTAQTTLSRAVFASHSCFEWAWDCGISTSISRLSQSASLYVTDPETLLAARNSGLPRGENVLAWSVSNGSLPRYNYLYPWSIYVLGCASQMCVRAFRPML
jgi:hypothetical protein